MESLVESIENQLIGQTQVDMKIETERMQIGRIVMILYLEKQRLFVRI